MTAKLVGPLRNNDLVDFVKEAQRLLDAEAAQKIQETEAVLFKNRPQEVVVEAFSRKHFELAASTLKDIPDRVKRKELANHHAKVFAASNPRFDKKKFFQAAGINESYDRVINESQDAHDVYLKGKKIDTVFSTPGSYDAEGMKKSLINHDGYHSDIVVKTRKTKVAKK